MSEQTITRRGVDISWAHHKSPIPGGSVLENPAGFTRALDVGAVYGIRTDGKIPPTMEEQVECIVINIYGLLAAAGMAPKNLNKLEFFTPHLKDAKPHLNEPYQVLCRDGFGEPKEGADTRIARSTKWYPEQGIEDAFPGEGRLIFASFVAYA